MASGLGQQNQTVMPPYNISDIIANREVTKFFSDFFFKCCLQKGMSSYTGFSYARKNHINNRYIPNSMSDLDKYSGKVFCGIFSKDGKYFITASQGRFSITVTVW